MFENFAKFFELAIDGKESGLDVDPDKLIEPITVNDAQAEGESFPCLERFEFISTLDERMKSVPAENENCDHGQWESDRGESKFIPHDENVKKALAFFSKDGIEYRKGIPDFSPISIANVKIDMTADRYSYVEVNNDGTEKRVIGNFEKADTQCAMSWNESAYLGRTNWISKDVAKFRTDCKLTWHECSDRNTCMLVPQSIHSVCRHTGGVSECKLANEQEGRNS
jgi:hypothetical protein